jgi:hypothetical protein
LGIRDWLDSVIAVDVPAMRSIRLRRGSCCCCIRIPPPTSLSSVSLAHTQTQPTHTNTTTSLSLSLSLSHTHTHTYTHTHTHTHHGALVLHPLRGTGARPRKLSEARKQACAVAAQRRPARLIQVRDEYSVRKASYTRPTPLAGVCFEFS